MFHDLRDDGFEDGFVGFVGDAVAQREVARVHLAFTDTNVTQLTRSREEFAVLVERTSHDPIGGVESFFDTVAVMNVDIDVQHTRVVSQQFENAEYDIVDVAKPTGFTLLCVMQPTCPVDRNIAFVPTQPSRTFHTSTGTDRTVLEQAIKDGAVVANVELGLFANKRVDVVRGDSVEEFDVFVGVKLRHLAFGGGLGAEDLHTFVEAIVHDEGVAHSDTGRFHRVAWSVVVVANVGVEEVAYSGWVGIGRVGDGCKERFVCGMRTARGRGAIVGVDDRVGGEVGGRHGDVVVVVSLTAAVEAGEKAGEIEQSFKARCCR